MRFDLLTLSLLPPIFISMFLTVLSNRNLSKYPLIAQSRKSLLIFLSMRLFYWIGFGILSVAFIIAVYQYGVGGQQARELIAKGVHTSDGTANYIMSDLSNVLLPIIFASLFIAVIALGIIGRKVVTMLPEEVTPGEEFSRFRFTFVILAMSLIFPPLIFGSLLLL
ncbi:MAG: hypothetical protein WCH46_10515 [bacterium]